MGRGAALAAQWSAMSSWSARDVFGFIRSAGPSMSPFNAWVFLKGLETLELRMKAHSVAALELARWLERQPGVRKVHYAGLESHPSMRSRDASNPVSAASSPSKSKGRAGAWSFIDATQLMSITANLGDVENHDHASGEHHALAHHCGRARTRRHHRRLAAHLRGPREPRRSEADLHGRGSDDSRKARKDHVEALIAFVIGL